MFLKTPLAAQQLGVSYWRLMDLLRGRKIAPPAKDSSGDYCWSQTDIEAARLALAKATRRREAANAQ